MLARMSAGEIAAVIGGAVAALVLLGCVIALANMLRTLRTLAAAIDDLRKEVVPLASQWRATVVKANDQLVRVDGVLDTTESVGSTVDAASRLIYLALSNPLIKAMAFGAGTSRALRRLRRTEK
jgi:outer membrane murein-binding lipoprotein Lpp